MENTERIDIIRGANITLWGSHAVNDVINIINRSASETQADLLAVGIGNVKPQITFKQSNFFPQKAIIVFTVKPLIRSLRRVKWTFMRVIK